MATTINMPKLGLTMEEGTIQKWHKQVGDKVESGDILFDVETDKLTNEIESTESGTLLKIMVAEGETTNVLEPVAIIGEENESV